MTFLRYASGQTDKTNRDTHRKIAILRTTPRGEVINNKTINANSRIRMSTTQLALVIIKTECQLKIVYQYVIIIPDSDKRSTIERYTGYTYCHSGIIIKIFFHKWRINSFSKMFHDDILAIRCSVKWCRRLWNNKHTHFDRSLIFDNILWLTKNWNRNCDLRQIGNGVRLVNRDVMQPTGPYKSNHRSTDARLQLANPGCCWPSCITRLLARLRSQVRNKWRHLASHGE